MEATQDVVVANEINAAIVETSIESQCVRELSALELSLVGGGAGSVLFF